MALAKKCDRCQCVFEGSTIKNPDAKIEVSTNISDYGKDRSVNPFCAYAGINAYDLCPSCYEEFKKFMLMTNAVRGFGG